VAGLVVPAGQVKEGGLVVVVRAVNRRVVLYALASKADPSGVCRAASYEWLVDATGLSPMSVRRAVRSLLDDGYAGRLRRRGEGSLYRLLLGRKE
jgi:DNA-binding transcriptional ArsR family regulator